MTNSTSLADYPNGFLLLLISFIDPICQIFNFPQWQEHLPFGLGDSESIGWLSHEVPEPVYKIFPKLLSYQDYLQQTNSQLGLSSLYTFAFKTSSTTLGDVTSSDALLVLMVLVLILRKLKKALNPLFCSIGRTLARKRHGLEWEKQNEEKITKFGEYVFRLIYHFSLSLYGVVYFYDKPWWDKSQGGTTTLWKDFPFHEIPPGMSWYYMLQCAYNVDAYISLIELSVDVKFQNPFRLRMPIQLSWKPTVRGDFREMYIHHVITNCLVIGSSFFRLTRVGSMVFLIHDISDVPVDMSKLANFLKSTKTTIVCFATMVIVWAITRMTILPFVIAKSIWSETYLLYDGGHVDPRLYKMYFGVFFPLVVGIILLHYFWFTMFIKIAYYLIAKGKVQDYTEHKNDEAEVEVSKKKN